VEAIAVADAGHLAEEGAAAEVAGVDVIGAWEAAKVGLVEGYGTGRESGGRNGGDPVVRDAEVIADAMQDMGSPGVGLGSRGGR
jgi:hypothetical protein